MKTPRIITTPKLVTTLKVLIPIMVALLLAGFALELFWDDVYPRLELALLVAYWISMGLAWPCILILSARRQRELDERHREAIALLEERARSAKKDPR